VSRDANCHRQVMPPDGLDSSIERLPVSA